MLPNTEPNPTTPGIKFLLSVSAAATAILAPAAMLVAGVPAVSAVVVSMGICLLPGLLICVFPGRFAKATTSLLVATFLRMGLALALFFFVRDRYPKFGLAEFHAWLALSYFVSLAVDTYVVLKSSTMMEKAS